MNDKMTSFPAKATEADATSKNVVFVVYPNIVLLDLVGPLQVFTHARTDAEAPAFYRTFVVSKTGGTIMTNTVLPIGSDAISDWEVGSSAPTIHTLVVVGGDGALEMMHDHDFVRSVRALANRSERVCSVCSGALILAAAGVLDGRRAVTHWEDCDHMEQAFPNVRVEVDPIYVQDGNVWTSAGITAGIDMALAIVAADLGKQAAIDMARSLVTPMVRSGGQSQFSAELDRQARDANGKFAKLHMWVSQNLAQSISVADMALECGMSERNFSRRYSQVMGLSPAKAVEVMRVDTARELLATSDNSIKSIAVRCGFQDDERMRRAFYRHIMTSPSQYRAQFQRP